MPLTRWAAPLALVAVGSVLVAGVGVAGPRAVADPTALRGFADCASLAAVMAPRVRAAEDYSVRTRLDVPEGTELSHEPVSPPDPMFWGAWPDAPGTTTVAPGAEAPDGAKLDGSHLISVGVEGADEYGAPGELIVRLTELGGRTPGERGRLILPGVSTSAPSGLLVLANHRVLVVSSAGRPEGDAVVALLDATDPARPVLLRRETVTGSLSSVWLRDGLIGMVLSGRPAGLIRRSADPPDRTLPLNHNWTLPRPADAAALLPGRQIVDGGGHPVAAGPLLDCAQVWAPPRDAGAGMVTVRTLDPADGDAILERGRAFGVLADGDLVAAGTDRVFVASHRPYWQTPTRRPSTTEFHAFERKGTARMAYVGSGSIPRSAPNRSEMSAHGRRLRMIVGRGTTYYANENDAFVLTEKDGRLTETARRTELWRDEWVQAVLWRAAYAVVLSRSNKGGGAVLRRLELTGEGLLGESALLPYGNLADQLTPLGSARVLAMGRDEARPIGSSPPSDRGHPSYMQASVLDPRIDRPIVKREDKRILFDRVNLPTDVSDSPGTATYLAGIRTVVILGSGSRPCSDPACFNGIETYPVALALRVGTDGTLRLAGRLDDPGQVQRVLEHDGDLVLLTDKAVLLTDAQLRVRKRIPRPQG